ncbi:MAG: DUF167 domain-containing protein [Brevinematia bacterium]
MKKEEKSTKILLKVIPNSSETNIERVNDELRIKVKSPPVEGKANKEIIEYLSKFFSIPKANVIIEKGIASRHKIIKLIGISKEDINL